MMDVSALFTLSYGLYVVGTRSGDKLNGQIANTVFQVTDQPNRIALSINKTEFTHEIIVETGKCCIGVLSTGADLPFIGRFGFKSGRDTDKFADIPYDLAPSGCPIPSENILSYIDLRIVDSVDLETHTLFVSEVTDCGIMGEGQPMTYAFYQQVLRGRTPPTATSYRHPDLEKTEEENGKEPVEMKKYVCNICGYVYDPAEGDPDGGIKPGTAFEDIPEDWVCPVCGVGKDQFSPE